jgi:hypothetical protein
VGADSGRVSSLLVYICVHSPIDDVSFDFLHQVDCHQLGCPSSCKYRQKM